MARLSRSNYAEKLSEFPGLVYAGEGTAENRGNWSGLFRERIGQPFDGKLIFEIGCFDAGYLTRMAARHPQTAFIGLDWKCKPLYDGARKIADAGLPNIVLLRERAQHIRRIFTDGEIDEVWVFHPDPCDKPAELQNRLITAPFLADVHAVLRDDRSRLCVKTDHPGYYQWMLALLGLAEPAHFRDPRGATPRVRREELMRAEQLPQPSPLSRKMFDITCTSADFWNDPAAQRATSDRIFAGETTLFEARFIRKRMPIYYVELRKRSPVEHS